MPDIFDATYEKYREHLTMQIAVLTAAKAIQNNRGDELRTMLQAFLSTQMSVHKN